MISNIKIKTEEVSLLAFVAFQCIPAEKILPTALVLIDIFAAIVYFSTTGDLRKSIYWLSAAVLTASVTF